MEMTQATDISAEFNSVEGIEAFVTHSDSDRVLVKVMDESAVGQFFKLSRELNIRREATERNCLKGTVLDSFVYTE